jgi:D-glycero-D-manno-heptose 1,7-bisphosphate phosphatase
MAGVFSHLRDLAQAGYRLVIITNQSAIGRGMCSEVDYQQLTQWMLQELAAQGIHLAGVYHCPHLPDDGCECRKPAPGMILRAAREHDLDLSTSWMIGDRESDMEAARRAGVARRVLIDPNRLDGPASDSADMIFSSLVEATRWIVGCRETSRMQGGMKRDDGCGA